MIITENSFKQQEISTPNPEHIVILAIGFLTNLEKYTKPALKKIPKAKYSIGTLPR